MWICSHLRLLSTVIFLTILYYADILSDFAVLLNYYRAHEYGFFGVTTFAIFSSLLAQILYSPLLSIYHDHTSPVTTLSCTFRLVLSTLYGTPFYLLYKFLVLQCCRLAKGSRDELQLAKISDSDANPHSMDIAMLHHIPMIDEQQREDPHMIDDSFLDSGVLTESVKLHLLQNMVDDLVRYSLLKSCFQSSVHVFVQAVVIGEYYLFSDQTRRSHRDDIALSTNDVLLFPDTVDEVYLLNISCIISFVSLCTASWSQISEILKSSPVLELNVCIPSLFVLRAILESTLRVLRFMAVAVVFGALYGVIVMVAEMAWKVVVLSRCDRKRKSARIRRREDRKRKSSGYSGRIEVDRNGKQLVMDQAAYSPMASSSNSIDGGRCRCRCDLALWKGMASWMLFSRERFEYIPYLMRSTDIVLWTVLLIGGTCVAVQVTDAKIDAVCPQFLQFQVCRMMLYYASILMVI